MYTSSKNAPRIIIRPANPDKLDAMLRVNTSLGWIALSVLAATALGGVVWSFIGTAPVKVGGRGMLLSSLGIADITTGAPGKLTVVNVQVGDRVLKGDVVAELSQPDASERLLSKELELNGLRNERKTLVDFQARVGEAQLRVSNDRRKGLEARIVALKARVASMLELERNTKSLFEKGFTVQSRMMEVTNERARAEDELSQSNNSLIQIQSEAEGQRTQNARELLNADIRIATAEREIDVLRNVLSRTTAVRAPVDGTIVESSVNLNEVVSGGVPIFRMLPRAAQAGEGLVGTIYVPSGDGKRVRVGMAVQVVPANVRLQRDGFVEGTVTKVADLPATRESMQRVLKNSSLVEQLTSGGPPYEVSVALTTDPATPSGLRWSTGNGTPRPLESGTITDAKLIVDDIPLIALVIPRAEAILSRGGEVWRTLRGLLAGSTAAQAKPAVIPSSEVRETPR